MPCDEEDICFVRAHAALDVRTWIAFWVWVRSCVKDELDKWYILWSLIYKLYLHVPGFWKIPVSVCLLGLQDTTRDRTPELSNLHPLKHMHIPAFPSMLHMYPHRCQTSQISPGRSIMAMAKNLMTAMVEFLANQSDVPCYWFSMFSSFDMTAWQSLCLLTVYCFVLWQRIQREGFCLDLHSMLWNPVICEFRIHSVLAFTREVSCYELYPYFEGHGDMVSKVLFFRQTSKALPKTYVSSLWSSWLVVEGG